MRGLDGVARSRSSRVLVGLDDADRTTTGLERHPRSPVADRELNLIVVGCLGVERDRQVAPGRTGLLVDRNGVACRRGGLGSIPIIGQVSLRKSSDPNC